ncbi:probable serine/threonine-protein kinase roco9 [Rhagoletis pomonella]|nr:probable serine/threonine-protein kinase roco9 [Rhagoletis pomonella]XP_036321436.1 probable serine/threonine-protein kinase roco9 [Rhagoletis pomonella]XP_036321437.1 probable serine/threonine-protein kinase roco9 [Rhagoletis pomonella]XP_036321438.1 probable serine/threonine-protein kinase roco9 [Rhagoletis pomonella]
MKAIASTNRIKEFAYNYSEPSTNITQAVVMASDSNPSSSGSSNTLPLDYSSPVCGPRKTMAKNEECSRAEQSAPATETATASIAKELGASAGSEDTTKLISTAIKFININNNNSNSCSNNSNSDKQRTNSRNTDAGDSNKSTSKSTGTTTTSTTVAKSAASKFINSRNKLTTTTIVGQQEKGRTQEQQQHKDEEQQQQQQQAEQMFLLPTTRDLNQINLKSSLYVDQQLCNGGDNNINNNNSNNRSLNQRNDVQSKLNTNVSSNSNNNNNLNNANNINNNKKKKQQQQQQPQQLNEMSRVAYEVLNNNNSNNNNSANASNEANDSEHNNNNNNRGKSQVNAKKQKNSNNHNDLEELEQQKQPPRQQSLITVAKAAPAQTTIVNELKATTKVRAEKIATTVITPIRKAVAATTTTATTIKTPAIERAKTSQLTLRKSLSTPASFKIGDVAWSTLSTSNNNNEIKQTDSKVKNSNNRKLIISSSKTKNETVTVEVEVTKQEEEERKLLELELVCGNKDDSGGGGGGGDGVSTDSSRGKCTKPAMATPMTIANLVPPAAANNTKAKSANASIEEAITFTKAITATMKSTACTSTTTTKASATMDVVMRSQYVAHAPPHQHQHHQHQHHQHQHHQHQHHHLQQQQQQRHHQQSNTKIVKAKTNDNNQVIHDDVSVVASTTTAPTPSSSLPRPNVSFDLDLRFGCAHYKRRAMFVTPCCNKFYKCRFCHDENESHHFDRKTLTELICSECNTRQKVQEQCEACGTRFGKYTCLICNLFDDTDKKQYHCNGCGICRIGGAENFFHCEVCDMCLPIRLKIDGHRCVENISRSHCPVCLGDIHTSRIPCHIPDCGHLLHKTCFDQLLNSGHYTCPICQTSLIDMTALWEYLDAQAVSLPVPKKYENQRIHIFCNDCHKTSKTKFNFIGLKCMQCGAYNTTQDVKRRMSLVTDEPSSA